MSDTPRTDLQTSNPGGGDFVWVPASLARKLERELAAALEAYAAAMKGQARLERELDEARACMIHAADIAFPKWREANTNACLRWRLAVGLGTANPTGHAPARSAAEGR